MNGKGIENELTYNRDTNLYMYITVLLLLLFSRIFDILTTYLATPDLSGESNFLVRYLGFGWTNLYIMNAAVVLGFFFLFVLSWSEFTKNRSHDYESTGPSVLGFVTRNVESDINGPVEPAIMQRNVAYEIGITLPVYVIITGYFQGAVNIMVYLGLIVVSFTQSQFLYPVMIGGVFGIISHFFARNMLYSGQKPPSTRPHKVMVSRKP